jgi:hypothetical protein
MRRGRYQKLPASAFSPCGTAAGGGRRINVDRHAQENANCIILAQGGNITTYEQEESEKKDREHEIVGRAHFFVRVSQFY